MRRNREPGTRKPAEPAAVEAADDRLLAELADIGHFAGGEDALQRWGPVPVDSRHC